MPEPPGQIKHGKKKLVKNHSHNCVYYVKAEVWCQYGTLTLIVMLKVVLNSALLAQMQLIPNK